MIKPSIKVSLRLTGDHLVPSEVSEVLGCEPSEARTKGEEIVSARFARKTPTGVWILRASTTRTLDDAIQELLEKVNLDAAVWHTLTQTFRAEVLVGLFSDAMQTGLTISSKSIRRLADLGLAVSLDIYCTG